MLTATRQRRITYVLLAVCFFYLLFVLHNSYQSSAGKSYGSLRAKPIKILNNMFGLNMSTAEYYDTAPLYIPNCRELIAGNETELDRTIQHMKTHKQPITDNEYYIKVTKDCPKFLQDFNYTETYHQVPLKFPTAYIITAHTSAQQFNLLMHALYNEHNVYCVHVDNSSDPVFREAIEKIVNCIPNVFVSTVSENIVENDHSELRAEFHCLRDLISLPTHWKYVLNLDETSFPLKTNSRTTDILKNLGDYNMILGSSKGKLDIADDRYVRYRFRHIPVDGKLVQTDQPKSAPPKNFPEVRWGSPYYAATRGFVQFILSNYYSIEFYNWLNETYAPRELFWASLNQIYMRQQNLKPMSLPPPHYYKLRATPFGKVADDKDCQGVFYHNKCVWSMDALGKLLNREEIFASRFDIRFDHVPLVCLDATITNPYEFNENMEKVP